jgi:hypothetical protein
MRDDPEVEVKKAPSEPLLRAYFSYLLNQG